MLIYTASINYVTTKILTISLKFRQNRTKQKVPSFSPSKETPKSEFSAKLVVRAPPTVAQMEIGQKSTVQKLCYHLKKSSILRRKHPEKKRKLFLIIFESIINFVSLKKMSSVELRNSMRSLELIFWKIIILRLSVIRKMHKMSSQMVKMFQNDIWTVWDKFGALNSVLPQ